MGCVHSVVEKKKFLVLFKYGNNKDICYPSLVYLSEKEEVDMEESISHLPEKEEGVLLTVNGDPEVGEPFIFVKGMYLSVFYCLCYDTYISTYMLEEQVVEERYPDLNEKEDIILDEIRKKNWRDVAEEGDDKKKIYTLRWEMYVKEKEELIKREFLVSVPHPKGGAIVWTCVKDHIIDEKED